MKANLKGFGGVKGILLLHGEKIAIALVGIVALWFVYSSRQLPRLDDTKQADDLRNEITQTTSRLKESQWPESPQDPGGQEVRRVTRVAKHGDMMVKPETYEISQYGFNRVVVAPTVLRADPVLLGAVEPRAIGGSGLFAFLDEDVRNKRILADRQREQEAAKKAAEDAQRQAQQPLAGEGVRNQGGRRGREGEFEMVEFDPDHPKRRPIDATTVPAGVPLQGDERIERAHWATVVAKVPIRAQMKLYEDAFKDARGGFDPARDFPRYVGYWVERSEVVRGQPLDWKSVGVYDGKKESIDANKPISPAVTMAARDKLYEAAVKDWAGGGQTPDVIDERYFDSILTLPLPPLVGRDWGAEATHPDIPLAINTPPLEEEVVPLAEQPTPQAADADENAMFRSTVPNQGIGVGVYGQSGRGYDGEGGRYGGGRYGGDGREGGGIFRGEGGSRYGGGGYGGGYGRGEEGGGRSAGYSGGRSGGQRTSLPRGVDYWLLRFFDFTVEPGKKYKYRVKLVLADPNYGLPENVLEPVVLDRLRAAKAKSRRTPDFRYVDDWSEPTPTVGIPLEGRVRLAKTRLPAEGKANDEPSVTLLVESFSVDDDNNAIQAAVEKEFKRGYVANLIEKDQEYLGPDRRWVDEIESFKFLTGITVLDVDGGESLAKDATVPARVLLMGPAGELSIRSELDDKPAIDFHKMIFEEDRRRGNRGEEEMRRSPYGGEGGGRYGR